MKKGFLFLVPILAALLGGCDFADADNQPQAVSVEYQFNVNRSGWKAGFADYAADPEQQQWYELDSGWVTIQETGLSGKAYKLSGINRSDDLFMFIQNRIGGFQPNQNYALQFEVTFASKNGLECAGIGGAPGESVFVKAAATNDSIRYVVDDLGHIRLNLDYGSQSQGSARSLVLGNVGVNTSCDEAEASFKWKTVTSNQAVIVRSNARGNIWAVVGFDSGYEGQTTVYISRVRMWVTQVNFQ